MRIHLPLLTAVACAGDKGPAEPGTTPTTPTTPPVSYARDVAPIFAAHCVDCHHAGSPGDYDFSDPFDPVSGIVGRENGWAVHGSPAPLLVDPGNPDDSFLITKVEAETLDVLVEGNPMPWTPEVPTAADLDAIEQWIAGGADDDAAFASEVAPVLGTEVTFGRDAGSCTYCHYPDAPNGLNVIDPFDPVQGLVGVASRLGGTRIVPGDPDGSVLVTKLRGEGPGQTMPLSHRRLTPEEIRTLKDWIAAGALDD